jgi:hypothetical protein
MSRHRGNVIILTSGLSGSSVLTGLISRSGYWIGDSTQKKEYDTYENTELVKLNMQLFEEAGYTGDYKMEFSLDAIARIASLSGKIDDRPFRHFVDKCDAHGPWIWKDPRLWLTIHFWKDILHLDECNFILLRRKFFHSWVSATLRRRIESYGSLRRYEESIIDSITSFLDREQLPCLQMGYENLIARPEATIHELNTYLATDLTLEDLKMVYRGPLHTIPRSAPIDYAKAILIYLKNYSQRADRIAVTRRRAKARST